ncbi:MAG: hypothetical protein PHX08_06740 [Lachnospiraceae bacterium]|nr:hypothetical protein [Lachnospiraceae bacterium]
MGREALHGLIDNVDENEIETVYRVLLKFVKEEEPLTDEIAAIKTAKEQVANGEIYSHEDAWK